MRVRSWMTIGWLSVVFLSWGPQLAGRGAALAQTATVEEYAALVDEHDTALPVQLPDGSRTGWSFNAMGGDRGVLNAGDFAYSWDGASSYRAQVVHKAPGAGWTWGGMWYSLVRQNDDDIPLDFRAIFGPHVASAHQGQVVAIEVSVSEVQSPSNNNALVLRLEAKNPAGGLAHAPWSFSLAGQSYPRVLTVAVDPATVGNVEQLLWVIDGAQVGDSVSVDGVRLRTRVPALPPEEQAFLWSYSWLMGNYNPATGMVKDKSRDGRLRAQDGGGDSMESVPATAKTAKIVYYAARKGYIGHAEAQTIIIKIADALINVVPRGPLGANTLWPHFTENGGANAVPPRFGFSGSEWSSGDTAYAALDIITALQLIGDPQGQLPQLEAFVNGIDWSALRLGDAVSHGYDDHGVLIPYTWRGFGMETLGVNWAYASATGQLAFMLPAPSDNGSGFIDNAQYPVAFIDTDVWGNDWNAYRNQKADEQVGWYCDPAHANAFLCDAQLFGLSAAETPEPDGIYEAYGIGGAFSGPIDGNSEVVVLHYAGMIADLRPEAAKSMWSQLVNRNRPWWGDRIMLSPLNNLESLRVDKNSGRVVVNHLKGSWNLVLQTEGWALIDADLRDELFSATQENAFLKRGFDLLYGGYTLHIGSENGVDVFPQEVAQQAHFTAVAAARMSLRYLDPTNPRSQQDLYTMYHTGTGGQEMAARDLAVAMNAETRTLGGYHFSAFADTDQLAAIRRIVHWMDYIPSGGKNVPAMVPTGGSMSWKVIRGFVADAKPYIDGAPFTIPPVELRGVWINDPRVTGLGFNVFQTASFFEGEYAPISGEYHSVLEPPPARADGDAAAARVARRWGRRRFRLARAMARQEIALLAASNGDEGEGPGGWAADLGRRLRRSALGRRPGARRRRLRAGHGKAMALALLRDSLPQALRADRGFMARFDRAKAVRRLKVENLDSGQPYVLLALGPDTTRSARKADIVVELDPRTRALSQVTWAEDDLPYPRLGEARAVKAARRALLDTLPQRGFRAWWASWRIRSARAQVSAVWAGRHDRSRFHPSYRIELAGYTVIVHPDGKTELAASES